MPETTKRWWTCYTCEKVFASTEWRLRCPECVKRMAKAMYDALEDLP